MKRHTHWAYFFALLMRLAFCGGQCLGAELDYPLNNAVLNEYNPELSWLPDASFDRTQVQVATDIGFNSTVNDREIHHFVNRFVPLDSYTTGDYWWRTRSRDKTTGTWGAWETGRKFTVAHNPTVNINLTDSFNTIRSKVINSANNTRIVFEQGTYTFNASQSGTLDYFLKLNNKSNVVVEGNGAEIVFDSSIGNLGFMTAIGSSDISLRNLTLKRDRKLQLATKITEVNPTEKSIVVERLNADYPLPAEDSTLYEKPNAWTIDPVSNKIKFGTTLSLLFDETQSGPQGVEQWKHYLDPAYPDRFYVLDNLSPGDILLAGEKYGNKKNIQLTRSSNVTIYNFDSHDTGPTINIEAIKNENVKILKSEFLRDGIQGQPSDSMHFKDIRGGAWIEGNHIQSNGDDGITLRPKDWSFVRVNDNTIDVNGLDDVRVGDLLHFFTGGTFNYTTEATIIDSRVIGSDIRLTLDSGVVNPDITSYSNFALAGNGTMVSGNTLEGTRGDAFHIALDGAIFENNVVRDLGERAFTIQPSKGGGAYSRDILITNNEFYNVKRFDDLGDPHGSFLKISGDSAGNRNQENIIFENNAAYGYPNTAISVTEANGVYVRNNTFSSGEYQDDADIPGDIVIVENAENVFVDNNQFLEFRDRPASERLELTNATGWAADNPNFDSQFVSKLWTVDRIGHSEAGSGVTFGDPIPHRSLTTFSLTGSGTMAGGAGSDSTTFANLAEEGDVGIKMKVLDLMEPAGTNFARTGLMIRESTDANSAFVMMSVRELGGEWFMQTIFRDATGGALTTAETSAAISFPIQIGLARNGNTFSSYFSQDGLEWELFHSMILDMDSSTLAGVAVTSQGAGLLSTLLGDELLVDTELDFFSFAPLAGDFNNDGVVDGADFLEWQRTDGTPAGLADWQANYGYVKGQNAQAVSSVPEPTSLVLLASALLMIYRVGRR